MTTTTSQTITRSQIRQLRTEARSAGNGYGDLLMVIACDMALHHGERNEDDVECLPLSQHHLIPAGEDEALEMCAQAIAEAQSQS